MWKSFMSGHLLWGLFLENAQMGIFVRMSGQEVEMKGRSLHGGLTVVAMLESNLPSCCLLSEIQDEEPTMTGSAVLAA